MEGTHFSLVYRDELVISIEMIVPSTQLAILIKLTNSHDQIYDVKALYGEKRRCTRQVCLIKSRSVEPTDGN